MNDNKTKINLSLHDLGDFFAKFTEHSEHVYWISSPDFKKIQFISPSFERIWGRPREELYTNPESWITFLHPDDVINYHPIHEMAKKVALLGDQARYFENYRIIRPDGEIRWIMDHGFPICNEKGECLGVTGIAIDVSAEKRAELKLKIEKERAETANLAKTEFIAHMSHDIRTPLTGLIGMSQRLVDCSEHDERKQYAQWIHDSSQQLLSLLNSILDVVSTQNLCEHDLSQDFFDLHACIKDLITLERPSIEVKGLSLDVKIDDHVPRYVISDQHKLHRILLNLLGNAIKFTQNGRISVEITALPFTAERVHVNFRIIDTGIGIAPVMQAKIFDQFYRISPTYQGRHSGHGVGLSIVQSYVALLGGQIQCDSEENKGTVFSVRIPLTIAHTTPKNAKVAERHVHSDGYASTKMPHLLLVEDNIIALNIIENLVQKTHCQYTSVTDAESAYAMLEHNSFDLIITDLGLPGLSGYELTKKIRQWEMALHQNPIPIVGLTAHANEQVRTQCLQAGMQDVFGKPMTLAMLQKIIHDYPGK